MEPVISVIIPVYNAGKYLRDSLTDILRQSEKRLEIICVDDSSSDNSLAILHELAAQDPRIRILQQEHKGGGAARNTGIDVARGEFLSFLDADDIFYEGMMEALLKGIQKHNADICIGRVKLLDIGNNTQSIGLPCHEEHLQGAGPCFCFRDYPEAMPRNNAVWNKLYRKSFLEKEELRFQEVQRGNDTYFNHISLLTADRICCIPDVLMEYRYNHGTNCQSTVDRFPFDICKVYDAIHGYYTEHHVEARLYGRIFMRRCLNDFSYNLCKFHEPKLLLETEQFYAAKLESYGIRRIDSDSVNSFSFGEKASMKHLLKCARPMPLDIRWLYDHSHLVLHCGGKDKLLKARCIPLCKALLLLRHIALRLYRLAGHPDAN